uniref:Uncharacterized protein n=1 Tax=Anguilla anguilla TaxID=7936 RepID=A0A0E9QU53_ANGAN
MTVSPHPSLHISYIQTLLNDSKSVSAYKHSISCFTQWCKNDSLQLNVTKTKEVLIGTPCTDSTTP